jgi:hypothetical protein
MPVCAIHLLSLNVPISQFLSTLSRSQATPLTVGRVVRWIITPEHISVDELLSKHSQWHILLILPNADDIPEDLNRMVRAKWTVRAGIPARLIQNFDSKNAKLLHPRPGDVPPLTGALDKPRITESSQGLELSNELQDWIRRGGKKEVPGAVSMLNLLAFRDGMKEEYLKYGKAFAESIGSRRGGHAKLVGNVLDVSSSPKGVKEWDEMALAHYPSIGHFADMLASEDYQVVNHQHRIPALKDTFILCTTELDVSGEHKGASKL